MLRTAVVVVILLVIGAMTIALTWASPAPQEQGGIVGLYENTTEGFSVVLPEGWVGQENEDNFPLLSIRGGEEDAEGTSPVIGQVWVIPRGDDSPAQAWMEGQLASFPVVSSQSRSYEGAESAHQLFTSRTTEEGDVVVDLWTAIARGSQMFLLRVQTGEPDWATYETDANAFTDSFALQAPMPFGASRDDSLFQSWGEILTLDPALSRSGAGDILGGIFSGLVKLDTDLQVVADMAESWEVSDNNTVFAFTLRDNARFHDGRAVTAADVKYSWERALHPDLESPVAHTYLGDIVGAQAMVDGEAETLEGVEVLDDRTLRVTITDPFSYFLSKLTYPTSFVVDRANVETGEDWTDAPNGTGAFKLKVWEKDRLLILERNEDWYGGAPALAHVVYRIFAGNPMQMYENGEIDLTGIYVNNIDRARDPANDLNSQLVEGTELCTSYLGFNVSHPPFDDPKVRQALALAMEADKQLEVTFKGLATRAAGFVPPGMFGHNEALVPSAFDLETAKQLLQESRYSGAENLPTITSYANDNAIHWAWREHLGLEVEAVDVFEFSDFLERLDNEEYGVFTAGWCADYPDPQNFLHVLFHSESAENRFGYENEQVDALLEEAAVESDPDRRASLYNQAEEMVLDDWVAVPLRHNNSYFVVRPYVKGFELTPIGVPQLQNISIEREQ